MMNERDPATHRFERAGRGSRLYDGDAVDRSQLTRPRCRLVPGPGEWWYTTGVADAEREQRLQLLNQGFRKMVPHNDALGIEVVDFGEGIAKMRLPWAEHLVGNPETGVLHGGVITSLLDATSG